MTQPPSGESHWPDPTRPTSPAGRQAAQRHTPSPGYTDPKEQDYPQQNYGQNIYAEPYKPHGYGDDPPPNNRIGVVMVIMAGIAVVVLAIGGGVLLLTGGT